MIANDLRNKIFMLRRFVINKLKILWMISILFMSMILGSIDFYLSIASKKQELKSRLNHIKYTVLETLQQDFDKIFHARSYLSIRSNLKYLNNAEIVKNRSNKIENTLVSIHNGFLQIDTTGERLLFSINEIKGNIKLTIGPDIFFDFDTTPKHANNLSSSISLISGSLFLNYGIKNNYMSVFKEVFLINSSLKSLILFTLSAGLSFCYFSFYNSRRMKNALAEVSSLTQKYSKA